MLLRDESTSELIWLVISFSIDEEEDHTFVRYLYYHSVVYSDIYEELVAYIHEIDNGLEIRIYIKYSFSSNWSSHWRKEK